MQSGTLQGRALANRYEVGRLLGSGGMADVYDGRDMRLDRPVAVKVLRPAMAAVEDVRRRFEAEARTAARLSHPNVVAVFDTGEDEGIPYIVMERLPGETLANRMAAGPVDQEWLRRVAGDVLLALGAAHGAGLVHRDVKPGNILISPEGCAKVADFGIAKTTEPLAAQVHTATNILIGTPSYLAPERVDGAVATPQTDLYALGVVLYEALTGRKPFVGPNAVSVAHAIRGGEYTPIDQLRPDVDPRLAAASARAMAYEPAERFATADDMRAAVEDGTAFAGQRPEAYAAVVSGEATTVMANDRTMVAPLAPAGPAPMAPSEPSPVGAVPPFVESTNPSSRRVPLALFGVLLAVLIVLLGAVALRSRAASGSATQATPQQHDLAERMDKAADRVRVGDGPKGPETADRLGKLASSIDDGKVVKSDATALLADVTKWGQSGELSSAAQNLVTPLLLEAGADAPMPSTTITTAPPPAPTTVAPAPTSTKKRPKGHRGD